MRAGGASAYIAGAKVSRRAEMSGPLGGGKPQRADLFPGNPAPWPVHPLQPWRLAEVVSDFLIGFIA